MEKENKLYKLAKDKGTKLYRLVMDNKLYTAGLVAAFIAGTFVRGCGSESYDVNLRLDRGSIEDLAEGIAEAIDNRESDR